MSLSAGPTNSQAEMLKPGPIAIQSQQSSSLPKVTLNLAPQKATSGGDVDHDGDSHKHGGEAVFSWRAAALDISVPGAHGTTLLNLRMTIRSLN